MAEPARSYLHLVNTRNVSELGPRLLPYIADLGDEPALSPDRSPAPTAPVFLIHGMEDNVVPAAETAFLAEHLRGRTAVRVLVTPLISHAEVDRPVDDLFRFILFSRNFKGGLTTQAQDAGFISGLAKRPGGHGPECARIKGRFSG